MRPLEPLLTRRVAFRCPLRAAASLAIAVLLLSASEPAIAQETRAKVAVALGRHRRAGRSSGCKSGSMGIGLFVSRSIIERGIAVVSGPGRTMMVQASVCLFDYPAPPTAETLS